MNLRKTVSLAISLLLLSTVALAQGSATGDLHVIVKDPNGGMVTNATVAAREEAKGLERSTNVNAQGEYRIVALPPGNYAVTVDAPGFAKTTAEHVSVTVGQMAELPVALTIAGGREVVEVNSQAALVETTRTSTTDTIGQRRIDNLPINGRNYINFALTDSQVLRDNAPSIGAAPTSGLNISGQRGRSNLVNVDGADAVDNSVNGVRSTVSQEAVQEFQIITNSYGAEFGRAAGGVVNIITRSGSNEMHGTVFGYLRNRNFQAVNPFSTVPNPAYTRVQAGAAFGGPIQKDKTYYYFSYEVTRRHETGFSSVGAPNSTFGMVNTDVSTAFGFPQGSGFVIQATPQQAAALTPTPPPALAPYAILLGAASGIGLNSSYPASFAALVQAGFLPTPSNGSNPLAQFFSSCNINPANPPASNTLCNGLPGSFFGLLPQAGNYPIFEGTSLYSLRLDHNLSNSNHLILRTNVSPSTITGIQVNGENQTFGQNAFSRTSQQTYRDAAGVVQDTLTIGNNKVNELRFQYARRGLQYFYSNAPGGSAVAVNIPGVGFTGREPYSYIQRTEQRYQFADNFSWTIGRNDTKFGVDFNYIPIDATFTVNYGGVYTFGGLAAAQLGFPGLPDLSPVQAYGLGIPNTLVQGIGNPKDSFTNKPLGVFYQDSWRARSNLTFNLGVRYDIEFPPKFTPPGGLALAAYNALGLQKGIQTDTNNFQPRVGVAWDPRGNSKSVVRASYGMFYDHPLLGLYFLGDASDGSKSGQLLFAGGAPCDQNTGNASPLNLNATNIFQGIQTLPSCVPSALAPALGYLPSEQRFNAFFPNSLFINQNYLTQGFPLAFQPFGYPQAKNFVYAYSQQANLTFEQDLGHNMSLSLAYNFNGGRHLNRPINANTTRGDLLLKNWQAAIAGANAAGIPPSSPLYPSSPLGVSICPAALTGNPTGQFAPAAMLNFFRPSGLNPSLAGGPCLADAALLAKADGLGIGPNGGKCDPTLAFGAAGGCVLVPFSDMDANFSNGSSVYHGFTANLKKRFSEHYEFLASYTWSHAIDDSTDLQSPLAPQDSFFPSLERSNSLFDQHHRFVFSGVYQTGKLSGEGFARHLLSNWTVAPLIEFASGRPFNIITGNPDNFQFSPSTGRPNVVPAGAPNVGCGAPVPSKFSPTGFFQEPCFAVFAAGGTPTLLALDGNFPRNGGLKPWTVFNDLRVARRINFGERIGMDLMVDMFNLANRFNVADVNPLFTAAGQPTAAYDPRQFQFAMKLTW